MIDRYDILALQQQAGSQPFDRKNFHMEPKALAVSAVAFANADRSDIVLVEFMREYKLVKESGEGVDRMFREMSEAGNPSPEYKQVEFMVKVRLNSALRDENVTEQKDGQDENREKNRVKGTRELGSDQKNDQKLTKWPEKWPEKVCQIIDVLKKDQTITIAKLDALLGLGHTTLKKILREMQNENLIRRVGPDKGGHWEVIEQKEKGGV